MSRRTPLRLTASSNDEDGHCEQEAATIAVPAGPAYRPLSAVLSNLTPLPWGMFRTRGPRPSRLMRGGASYWPVSGPRAAHETAVTSRHIWKDGAGGGIRTLGLLFTKQLLYL